MGLSDALIIIGAVLLFVYIFFLWATDTFGITIKEGDFTLEILPYFLFLGLLSLGSGIGIKVYQWKNPSRH